MINVSNAEPSAQVRNLTWAQVSTLLESPIAFHRIFATIGGNATSGLFLSQLFYWTRVMEKSARDQGDDFDGWLWKEQAEWEEETALTRREQETARKMLKERGVLEERFKGLPRKLYYRLNKERLLELMDIQCAKTPLHNGGKRHYIKDSSAITESALPTSSNGANVQTLIGAENTSETTFSDDVPLKAGGIADLIEYGLPPAAAKQHAKERPSGCQRALDYLRTNPAYLKKRKNPAGAIVDIINNPERYPVKNTPTIPPEVEQFLLELPEPQRREIGNLASETIALDAARTWKSLTSEQQRRAVLGAQRFNVPLLSAILDVSQDDHNYNDL